MMHYTVDSTSSNIDTICERCKKYGHCGKLPHISCGFAPKEMGVVPRDEDVIRIEKSFYGLTSRISELEDALIEERRQVLAYSPDYIAWREKNDMPSELRSDEDWEPYRKAASQQLMDEGLLWRRNIVRSSSPP